jgi:hypothetical protein
LLSFIYFCFSYIAKFYFSQGKKITENMQLTAENGKKMPAVRVFSEAIRFLKEHLDKTLARKIETTESSQQISWADDIRWILTVPAIWSNEAKQFMRVAAEQVSTITKLRMRTQSLSLGSLVSSPGLDPDALGNV